MGVITDKFLVRIQHLFNYLWLSHYPRETYVLDDNGSEYKLPFKALCNSNRQVCEQTSIKSPQANSIIECICNVIADMMHTPNLDMQDSLTMEDVANFITSAAWAICSTYHTVQGSMPGQTILGSDMLFSIAYLAYW